ncbi:hypothetical protein MTP99_016982 [Tenebrio molitor]|nr:hypothetical protein MTP99_016982 [Tenebrio molitor]
MVNATGKKFTYVQVDTKWKGLVKTYKDVQKHNNTSGKNRKQWQYFELMHDILYQKPEINPVATCSNLSGLQVRTSTVSPATPTTSRKIDFESSFSKKRKSKEDAVERRHAEKMQRLDKLQSSIDKMLEALTK